MSSMDTKLKCSACKEFLPTSEFTSDRSTKRGFQYTCKACVLEHRRKPEIRAKVALWERNHREDQRKARRTRRIEAIKKLGGKCECCGESQIEFLAFDHIHGLRGRGKKRNGGDAADALALKIKKEASPEKEFRILCHNCNTAKHHLGKCPHQP